ncbi:MAG: PKD domain-containing protein [Thermoplasmatota archaeon]
MQIQLTNRNITLPLWGLLIVVLAAAVLALADEAEATHYRFGTLNWEETGNGNEVAYHGEQAWRRSFGSFGNPGIGDVFCVGTLQHGDGSSQRLCVKTTAISTAKDWAYGELVDRNGNELTHTYSGNGPYLAYWESNARISPHAAGQFHVNNPDQSMRLETSIDFSNTNDASPVATMPPIVDCLKESTCDYIQVPAYDNDGDTLSFRLATEEEVTWSRTNCCDSFVQPGFPGSGAPNPLSVDPATGFLHWDTRGATVSNDPNEDTLYSAAVVVEDGFTKTIVDFFIRLADPPLPLWDEPPTPCGNSYSVAAGQTITFTVQGRGGDTTRVVDIDHLGLPAGSSFTLPATAYNPSSTFTWNTGAGDIGDYLVTFTLTDDLGKQAPPCNVELHVDPLAAPVAEFSCPADPAYAGTPVSFTDLSSDSDGTLVSWAWDFENDGTTDSSDQNPTHTYPAPGDYTVRLDVADNDGLTDHRVKTCTILEDPNDPPQAAFTSDPEPANPGSEVQFTDESTDNDGNIESWHWDFGDGTTSNEQNPTHTYDEEGDYTACLTVTDDDGASDTTCNVVTVVNEPPVADFTWSPTTPTDLEDATFTDLSTDSDGTIVSWSWDFGDGATSGDQHPVHGYADNGDYTVCLTATDDDGASDTACKVITVLNVAPAAGFDWSPEEPTDLEDATFTDLSADADGTVVSWSWDFGDGATSNVQHPVHGYADNGDYTVCLTVTDNDGATDTSCQVITVLNVAPTAAFTGDPASPSNTEPTDFTDGSSDPDGTVESWSWDFGDGSTSTDPNPSHQYENGGTYTVCLTVTDNDGATDTTCSDVTITAVVMKGRGAGLWLGLPDPIDFLSPGSGPDLIFGHTRLVQSEDEKHRTEKQLIVPTPVGVLATFESHVDITRWQVNTTASVERAELVVPGIGNIDIQGAYAESNVACGFRDGRIELGNVVVNGETITHAGQDFAENETYELPLGAKIVFNERIVHDEGYTVNAVHIYGPLNTSVIVAHAYAQMCNCPGTF